MGAKSRSRSSHRDPYSSSSLTAAGGRGSRGALLAGASLIALAALGAPGAASACSGLPQTISTVSGPIFSTGGSITVLGSGIVNGAPTGVLASLCSVSTLTNSGSIFGGVDASTGRPGGDAAEYRSEEH